MKYCIGKKTILFSYQNNRKTVWKGEQPCFTLLNRKLNESCFPMEIFRNDLQSRYSAHFYCVFVFTFKKRRYLSNTRLLPFKTSFFMILTDILIHSLQKKYWFYNQSLLKQGFYSQGFLKQMSYNQTLLKQVGVVSQSKLAKIGVLQSKGFDKVYIVFSD